MKYTKGETLLLLYDKFKESHYVSKADFMAITEIKDLTFRLYFAELRCYLAEFCPNAEIVYRKGDGVYHYHEY